MKKYLLLILALQIPGCNNTAEPQIDGGEENWDSGDWIPIGPDAGGKGIQDSTPYVAMNCVEYPNISEPVNHFGDSVAIATINSTTCHYSKSRVYLNDKPVRFMFYKYGFNGELAGKSSRSYILMWDEKDEMGVKTPGTYEWRIIVTYGNSVTKKYKGKWKV
jgi:hypothetical protein